MGVNPSTPRLLWFAACCEMWAALSRPRAALARSLARSIRPRTVGRPSPRLSLVRLCQSDDGKPKDEHEPVVVEVVDQDTVEAALAVDDSPFQFPDLLTLGIGRRPLLPGIIHPFKIEDPAIVDAVNAQMQQGQPYIGVFLLRNTVDFTQEGARVPMDESEIYQYGTLAQVVNLAQVKPTDPESDGGESWSLLLQGKRRVNLKEVISANTDPMMRVSADAPLEKPLDSKSDLVKAYTNEIMSTIKEILKLNPLFKEQLQVFIERVDATRPAQLSDFGAALTTAEASELQHVLEAADVKDRMEKTLFLLKQELELSKLQQTIGREVEAQISKEQRRYMLMQQLKKIKQELGIEKDEKEGVLERYNKRLEELGEVPEHAKSVIDDEMQKLSSLDPSSSEYNVVRNYLDWMTCLPWDSHSTDNFDVEQANRILDEDHYGMDDLKERILEFIAMGSLRGDVHGKILILHGPPGVGKTSIGSSIGRALNREFFRFSVGGMSDTSEIKGHRRTYVGAMPGKLIQSLKKTGKGNPIIMIDEIDKLGRSMSGDPSSALLEVLDPEQNGSFVDHYLDVPFDLSKVLFICTANDLDTISRPLLDRMEVLSVGG